MPSFEKLLSGYRSFKATTFAQKHDLARHYLTLGIKPSTLFITSCSLPFSPELLTSSNPGDLYVHRNLGGLVPPYDATVHGTIGAIQYAVQDLVVENIIVLGHSHCDGVDLMMDDTRREQLDDEHDPIGGWLDVMSEAREVVKEQLKKKSAEVQNIACGQETVLVCLKNLISYPFVERRIQEGDLSIYGWYMDIDRGVLSSFDPHTKCFEVMD